MIKKTNIITERIKDGPIKPSKKNYGVMMRAKLAARKAEKEIQ